MLENMPDRQKQKKLLRLFLSLYLISSPFVSLSGILTISLSLGIVIVKMPERETKGK